MTTPTPPAPTAPRRKYVPAVGPGLRKLLFVVLGLFALLAVNSTYLGGITLLESLTGRVYQDWFYLQMFLLHLTLGLAIVVPVVVFGLLHMRNAWRRTNRRAVRVGIALFVAALVLLATGIVLTRLDRVIVVKDPTIRAIAYWLHVTTPFVVAWLFVLHRLAGRRIRWRVGLGWAAVAVVFAAILAGIQAQDPRKWNVEGNPQGEKYFFPSLARTLTGDFIPATSLMNDQYCKECHGDIHAAWSQSVHRFSSFNNPPYLFSVRNTRKYSMEKDGNVARARFCAGCHDPVPFFSGQFNDPAYDDVKDPTAQAGITCAVCHSITHVNSNRGNGDYTIDAPIPYPFATSENPTLRWINRQLIKAKPGFHKKTFLKPLHKSPEFCGTCHKVHLPVELNDYKWLRGQNHFDSYLLSGVGAGVASFYYPKKAEPSCNGCHMPLFASEDFGARPRDESGEPKVHDHMFPAANTAIPLLVGMPDAALVVAKHETFLEGALRVDLFGLRRGGSIDGPLIAPLRPEVPALVPGESYLIETVLRTLRLGHPFTEGTADSNEVWVELVARAGDRVIGRSGERDATGAVDPWSHFVNSFVLDREGNRIDRRNPESIFVPLYNHQIPPGAADVVHYLLRVPRDVPGPITIEAQLLYRKFDTTYLRYVYGPDYVNRLPITTIARDRVVLPVAGRASKVENEPSPIEPWQRWNDYGIALLLKPGRGELRQAEEAFHEVERLGRADGPLNLARVYLRDGRVGHEAPEALRRAASFDPKPYEWTVLWLSGLVNKQNARLDEAIRDFEQILAGGFAQAEGRGFDFSRDYRLLNELALTLFERAKQERGAERRPAREALLGRAVELWERVLTIDSENLTAHYNLGLVYTELGDAQRAAEHVALHARYKPDDNARDRAVAAARMRYPAADRAAEAVVIYDLGPRTQEVASVAP